MPSLALICERTGVSDRIAAAISSSVLKDHGLISPYDKTKVVDRSKIRRERSKIRKTVIQQAEKDMNDLPISIFFDGRKDKTLAQVKKGNKYSKDVIVEEHITILNEPGSSFTGHTTSFSGSSENISNALLEFLNSKKKLII